MELETTLNYLTNRDIEKLKEIQKSVSEGTACTYDKQKVQEYLETIITPKCSVCRKPLDSAVVIVNEHKMHPKCRTKYKG
jgi:predicted nucleotidyltransferase